MLAEVHRKLVAESIDPVERSEDLLTDAVFGSLRHLPAERTLSAVLRSVGVVPKPAELRGAEVLMWPQIPVQGWPGKIIEPDVIVVFGRWMIVFEAKLYSQFDVTYRHPTKAVGHSLHQLAVQAHAVAAWAKGSGHELIKVVAVTAAPARPLGDLARAREDSRLLGDVDAVFDWCSWHRLSEAIASPDDLRPHEQTLTNDLMQLLELRGVRRMFTGFKMEDYWTVTAAQHVAGSRLYPQIRTFIDELTAVLDADDIGWSQPSYKGMWLGGSSTSIAKPTEWTRGFVGAQYWPAHWRGRGKVGTNLALYALFDFLDPGLEVGLSIPGPGSAAAQQHWTAHLAPLAEAMTDLRGLELVLDAGDVSRPTRVLPLEAVTSDVLGSATSLMTNVAHLRLRRRLEVSTVSVQEAREALLDLRSQLGSCQPLWDALQASGHVGP